MAKPASSFDSDLAPNFHILVSTGGGGGVVRNETTINLGGNTFLSFKHFELFGFVSIKPNFYLW